MQQHGFAPLFDADSKILVLGSFPSVVSRQTDFYYGNKRNRFWNVMQEVFGGQTNTVEQKKQLCLDNGIALWDIVVACNVRGSLDVNIKNPVFADLSVVLDNASITKILCNGQTAYKFTCKVYRGNLPVLLMPSTSPANVRFDKSVWTNELTKQ